MSDETNTFSCSVVWHSNKATESRLPPYCFYVILPFSFMIRSQRRWGAIHCFTYGCNRHSRNIRCNVSRFPPNKIHLEGGNCYANELLLLKTNRKRKSLLCPIISTTANSEDNNSTIGLRTFEACCVQCRQSSFVAKYKWEDSSYTTTRYLLGFFKIATAASPSESSIK